LKALPWLLLLLPGLLWAEPKQLPQQTINPFEDCAPATSYARQQLDRVLALLDYQGPAVVMCRSVFVPAMVAWSKLERMAPHPYINWKKLPVTTPYLSYNPYYLALLDRGEGGEILALALLAHQMGHHLKEHTDYLVPIQGLAPSAQQEIEADYYVGYALARLQVDREQLNRAQQYLFSLVDYPESGEYLHRSESMLQGWERAGGDRTIGEQTLQWVTDSRW